MAKHNEIGKSGEDLATDYLISKGYFLMERNWRSGHYELDIVAIKDETLVIVEVKTRSSNRYGRPEEAITPQKIRRTVLAANTYVRLKRLDFPIRFDVITITGSSPTPHLEHYEDAFRSPLFCR